VYLDSERHAIYENNSIKDLSSNEAKDITKNIKDNNFIKIKSGLKDPVMYDEAKAVYLDSERHAIYENNSIKDLSSNEAKDITENIKDNNFTSTEYGLKNNGYFKKTVSPNKVNYPKDRLIRIVLHQHAEPKNTATESTSENYIYICSVGVAFGNPDRRKKNKNNAKNADNSDSMITHIEPSRACLKLGSIADYILKRPERTNILKALSQQPKTFTDLLNETSLEKEVLFRYLRLLIIKGFVIRIDASPLLFTWSEELTEYYSLVQRELECCYRNQ